MQYFPIVEKKKNMDMSHFDFYFFHLHFNNYSAQPLNRIDISCSFFFKNNTLI